MNNAFPYISYRTSILRWETGTSFEIYTWWHCLILVLQGWGPIAQSGALTSLCSSWQCQCVIDLNMNNV